ncbi:DUF4097 family beta strand repeat-containing protein [Actinoplanes sp. NPDC023801]|uniref:DUF4097 family beta strand repeat-containing protein n=1 Tax=Actinoplanes sp. NPDC023801 TaxID=3154595 RepID=UPI0033DC4916
MPEFDTPESISVTIDLGVAYVRLSAGDRPDTVVEVRPTDESDDSDVKAAEQVRVDYSGGTLRVIGPKARAFGFSRRSRSVDVHIALPSGSGVSAEMQVGDFHGTGRLGNTRVRTAAGNVSLERTGPLRVNTAAGHVTADGVAGDADVTTGSGRVRIGDVQGIAVVSNSNGETTIDAATGDVRVRAANGDINVGRADAGVDAKTSNGSVRLGEVVRGSVTLGTAMGDLEVGIAEGTAAWLEVHTSFGRVRNQLQNAIRPEDTDRTVEVRGRTSYGDIIVHRS